jgi:hypothetical protein
MAYAGLIDIEFSYGEMGLAIHHLTSHLAERVIEKQAEDPSPLGEGMNAVSSSVKL